MKIGLFLIPEYSTAFPYLGLVYISTVLKNSGHNVDIFDWNIKAYNRLTGIQNMWEDNKIKDWSVYENYKEKLSVRLQNFFYENLKKLNSYDYDMFGFSLFESNWYPVIDVINKIREKNTDIKIVIGGPLTSLPLHFKETINGIKSGLFDAVVIGEGENKIIQIVENLENNRSLKNIPGVIFKDKNSKISYKEDETDIDLDCLPTPNFDGYDLGVYNYYSKNHIQFPFSMSRGCVNKCNFCKEWKYYKKYRNRSAENIVNDMNFNQKKHGVFTFFSIDLLMNGNFNEFNKFADILIKNKIIKYWGGSVRVDKRLTFAFFKKLKKAGCSFLIFGMESYSINVLKLMNKKIEPETAKKNIIDAYKANIEVIVNVLVSYPGETMEDFETTVKFLEENIKYISSLNISTYIQEEYPLFTKIKSEEDIMDYYNGKKKFESMLLIQDSYDLQQKKYNILKEINIKLNKFDSIEQN